MAPLLTWPFIRAILIAAVFLAAVVWLPLSRRYGLRRATLAALVVVVCSVTFALLLACRIEWVRNTRPIEGDWPSVIVIAALGGLCDFLMPGMCLGVTFGVVTLAAIGVLEVRRAAGSSQPNRDDLADRDDGELSGISGSGEDGTLDRG
jgi:hypothetical protein